VARIVALACIAATSAVGCGPIFGLDTPIVVDGAVTVDMASNPQQCSSTSTPWAIDPTSGKGVPASRLEWSALAIACNVAAEAPEHVWLMQELNGVLEDSIGTAPLSSLGMVGYGSSVAGWSRRGVATPDQPDSNGFVTGNFGKADGSTLVLAYVAVLTATTAERALFGIGASGDHRYVAITPLRTYEAAGAGVAPIRGTINSGVTVHPVVLAINTTRASYTLYTDQELIAGNWEPAMGLGPLLVFGSGTLGSANARYIYGAAWSGMNAEIGDSEIKAMLQGLGWTVTGY